MTHRLGTKPRDETVTERVVSAVATAENVDVTELDPLYDVVDPEALESLVVDGIDGHVAFTYSSHQVVVHGDGNVEVGGEISVPVPSAV